MRRSTIPFPYLQGLAGADSSYREGEGGAAGVKYSSWVIHTVARFFMMV